MVERHDAPAGTGMLLGRTGPVDRLEALFRRAVRGQVPAEQLRVALCRSRFDIALDGTGRPLIGPSPDGRPCVAVATSVAHRERVTAAGWRRVDLPDLVCLLPDRVDVLVNPTGPAPFRLPGNTVREALLSCDALAG